MRRYGTRHRHAKWLGWAVAVSLGVLGIGAVALGPLGHGRPVSAAGQALPLAAVQEEPAAPTNPLQELAERLLTPPYAGPDGQTPTVQLLPGQLPTDLPLELPAPADSRLIGSVVRGAGAKLTGTDVVLDVPGASADALAFYSRELPARGWNRVTPPGTVHGFQPTLAPTNAAFCRDEHGPWLSLTIVPKASGPNDVRLHADTTTPGPCANPAGKPGPGKMPPGLELIPALYAPAGVPLQTSGSGSGPGHWASDAMAQTDMGVAELEQHFAQQLRAAGWMRVDGQEDSRLAWSLWSVPGEGAWQGFLFALETPGHRRSLSVRVDSAAPSGPGGPGVVGSRQAATLSRVAH